METREQVVQNIVSLYICERGYIVWTLSHKKLGICGIDILFI